MRNAAAETFDHSAKSLDRPAKTFERSAKAVDRPAKDVAGRPERSDAVKRRAARGALALLRRHPIDALAALAAAAGVGVILVNALALQEGRHPAPFFQQSAAPPPPAAPRRSDLVARIQGELAIRGYYDGPVDGLHGARTSASITAFEQASRLTPAGEATEQALAALLTAPVRAPAPTRPAAVKPAAPPSPPPRTAPATTGSTSTSSTPSPRLMMVQRRLAKLGYGPVTIDGKMGAATRNALLAFERDRKMPATGEAGPQVLRELHAMTGGPLE